jgi:hypothetical protein
MKNNFKMALKDSTGSEQGPVTGSCKYSSECFGSINEEIFS